MFTKSQSPTQSSPAARTDAHLWAQTYDRDLADVFAIQSEIAKTIADQLQARLSPAEKAAIEQRPTADLAAFDLYVRATALIDAVPGSWTAKEKLLQAVNFLDQAIDHDPGFLLAYCKLAGAHDVLYLFGLTPLAVSPWRTRQLKTPCSWDRIRAMRTLPRRSIFTAISTMTAHAPRLVLHAALCRTTR